MQSLWEKERNNPSGSRLQLFLEITLSSKKIQLLQDEVLISVIQTENIIVDILT